MREDKLDWVIVAGAARSGTTMVRDLLTLHPRAAILHEYGLMRLRHALELITSDRGAGIGPDDVDFDFGLGRCSPLQLSTDDAARALFEALFDKPGLRVVGDKMPLGSGWDILDPAIERFGGMRYILVLREPGAVLRSSLRRRDQTALGLDSWPVADVAEACAEFAFAWLSMQRLLRAYPDRVLVLKFEDLCAHPEPMLDAILDFLGLPPAQLDMPAPRSRSGESEPELDAEELGFIDRFLEPLALDWHRTDARDLLLQELPVLCRFHQPMPLTHPRAEPMLVDGFSGFEPGVRWTDGKSARLRMRHEPCEHGVAIDLQVAAAHAVPEIGCAVDVSVNGAFLGTTTFTDGPARHAFAVAPERMRADGVIEMELHIHIPYRPALGGESRALGLGTVAITLLPAA